MKKRLESPLDTERFSLEEPIGKRAGRRLPPDPLQLEGNEIEDAWKWFHAMGGTGVPKGVYRFKTHQEADQWLWRKLAGKKRPDP